MTEETQPPTKRPFEDERKFIHDLATPTTTIHLLVETCIENLNRLYSENPTLSDTLRGEAARLSKVLDAAQKISQKLHDRRNLLIAADGAVTELT